MRTFTALASALLLTFVVVLAPHAPLAVADPNANESADNASDSNGPDSNTDDPQTPEDPVLHLGTVDHEPIGEMSGIIKSKSYENTWWVHNDSGDNARLFAIDAAGHVIYPGWLERDFYGETPDADEVDQEAWPGHTILNADNGDWEDIALADGKLYIAELGNNGNARRDLGVYIVNEPNPRAVDKARALRFIPVVYPDQKQFPAEKWNFDCEAIFFDGDTLCAITKHRAPGQIGQLIRGAKLYRLEAMDPNAENELTLVDTRDDLPAATAADVSPDGKYLAVLCVLELWVFERPTEGHAWLSGAASARKLTLDTSVTKQAEGVCWDDDDTLRVTNEQRDLFQIDLADLERVAGE